MIVAICAGGPVIEAAFSLTPDKWIGVDRGALYLIDHDIPVRLCSSWPASAFYRHQSSSSMERGGCLPYSIRN